MIQPVDRKRSIYIMYLVPRLADILDSGKQDLFIIKGTDYKFFNSSGHNMFLLMVFLND